MELDPLLVLLDFLVGDSVDTLARKNRLPHEHVEQALRAAMSSYGFDARCRDQSPGVVGGMPRDVGMTPP